MENYNYNQELDEELTINIKKIFSALFCRKGLIAKTFITILIFFILLTFVLPKKYKVDADLYINKSNNSNMAEINPYFISEIGTGSGMAAMLSGGGNLTNELELMQSPLVIDKVIQENDIRYTKLFGIFTTVKTDKLMTTDKFLKKKVSFEIKKGTNVITISYKDKEKDLAYNIVNSIINNYIELHKSLNTDKAKSDKSVLEAEYNKAKDNLNKKMNAISGIPSQAIAGSGGITAMSAFSKSAQNAMSSIQGQYVSGIKSEIALREETEKVAELAKKIEWAKLVDNMSDSSNVIVLKEPRRLQEYEQSSPKLFTNIILGIVFGTIFSFFAVIFAELTDRKLSFSMLSDNIIYDLKKDFTDLKLQLLANQDKNISIVTFENLSDDILSSLKEFKNITVIKADITNEFVQYINKSEKVVLFSKIGQTNSKLYKQIRTILTDMKKNILLDCLIK